MAIKCIGAQVHLLPVNIGNDKNKDLPLGGQICVSVLVLVYDFVPISHSLSLE